MPRSSLLAAVLLATAVPVFAQTPSASPKPENPRTEFCDPKDTRCGWFWGADFNEPEPEPEEEPAAEPPPSPPPPKPEPVAPPKPKTPPFLMADSQERCKHRETWDSRCGWVDPGKDWAFMKLQEEKLSQDMILNSGSAWSVKQYQRFVLWAIDKTTEVSAMWSYNVAQDQEINPNLRRVTTNFGLRWANTQQRMDRREFFEQVKADGGFLVYWSRSDCVYCTKMIHVLKEVERQTGLKIWNASLDKDCIKGFESACIRSPETLDPAARLAVRMVPDLMLHMPKENAWIRVSSGVEAATTIVSRMKLYAQGVRAAAISGANSDLEGQAAVDFRRQANKAFADTGFGVPQTSAAPESP